MALNKILSRSFPILLNATKSIVTPLLTLFFSLIVIKNYGHGLWGEFVEYLLFFYIAGIVINWGSKMYLLRLFSNDPSSLIENWQHYFMARLPLVGFFTILLFIIYNPNAIPFLFIWLLSLYINNSVVPIIFYNRDFLKMLVVEIIGFLLLFFLIVKDENLSIGKLITYYSISLFSISTMYLVVYKNFLNFRSFKINIQLLKLGLPFTLLAVTGFLQSKIDLYVFKYYADEATLGNYQIITGLFLFTQATAGVISLPYVKNIFRMTEVSINKAKNTLKWIGLVISFLATICILFVLNIYEIQLSFKGYIFGFFISFLCFLYTIDLYDLLKKNKEYIIVMVSSICLLVNLLFSIVLLSYQANIESVLLANSIGQLVAVIYYKYYT